MNLEEVLSSVSKHVEEKEQLRAELRKHKEQVSQEINDVSSKIRQLDKEEHTALEEVKAMVGSLNTNLSEETLKALDAARITLEKAKSNPEKRKLQTENGKLHNNLSSVEDALKSI